MRNPHIGKRGESPVVPAYLDEVIDYLNINQPYNNLYDKTKLIVNYKYIICNKI